MLPIIKKWGTFFRLDISVVSLRGGFFAGHVEISLLLSMKYQRKHLVPMANLDSN